MAVKNAGTVRPIIKATKAKLPKLEDYPVIKGPSIPKVKTGAVESIPKLPKVSVQMAKAAAGRSSNTSKRNSYYPTA